MASATVYQHFICHFCFNDFPNHASLLSHFPQCHIKNTSKQNDEIIRLPRLNKTDRDLLHMLKLHHLNEKFISNKHKNKIHPNLQVPLSMEHISSSKQSSFDDSICNTTNSLLINDNNQFEQDILLNNRILSSSSSYHTYKYSRRERKNFYASIKRARLKKQYISFKKSRINSLIFNQKKFLINLPTIIHSRQRLNLNSNNSYPLIFDPNFNSLVKISTNNLFKNYFSDINIYFHLLNSIASQEFQTIVNSNDNQHHVSYTAFSFINILRQTMTDYSLNLQKSLKRNYFQTFQHNESHIPTPIKIPRYNQSISSSSHIRMENNHHLETQTNNVFSPSTITDNINQIENNNTVIHPVQNNSILIHHQQSNNQTTTEPMLIPVISIVPIREEQIYSRSPSPIILREQKIEPMQDDEFTLSIPKARIRVMNGSNDNRKQSSSRKRSSNSIKKIDENSVIRSTRMSTRTSSIKTEVITEIYPSFETKPVILSPNEISKEWLTHTVFYRCHACSHEEFFVVLSRECMNLHLSSKHGNMEENFKQRLSNFINNKGRSLKIFQHYLKWQQPWSEKQIEQIFKLSNK